MQTRVKPKHLSKAIQFKYLDTGDMFLCQGEVYIRVYHAGDDMQALSVREGLLYPFPKRDLSGDQILVHRIEKAVVRDPNSVRSEEVIEVKVEKKVEDKEMGSKKEQSCDFNQLRPGTFFRLKNFANDQQYIKIHEIRDKDGNMYNAIEIEYGMHTRFPQTDVCGDVVEITLEGAISR